MFTCILYPNDNILIMRDDRVFYFPTLTARQACVNLWVPEGLPKTPFGTLEIPGMVLCGEEIVLGYITIYTLKEEALLPTLRLSASVLVEEHWLGLYSYVLTKGECEELVEVLATYEN